MLTKQQAKNFKLKLDQGDFPLLPKGYDVTLKLLKNKPPNVSLFFQESSFLLKLKRLRQMGLVDQRRNLTNFGVGYYYMEIDKKNDEKVINN